MPNQKKTFPPSETPKREATKRNNKNTPPAETNLTLDAGRFDFMFHQSIVAKSLSLPAGEMTANQAFCDMLGYSQVELQTKRWQEITHPEDIEMTQSFNDSLLSGEKDSARVVKRYLHKNGSVIWGDVSTWLRRDEKGQPLYIVTEIIDITASKLDEKALHISEQKNLEWTDFLPIATFEVDPAGNLVSYNQTALNTFGYKKEDFREGMNALQFFSSDEWKRVAENLLKVIQGTSFIGQEYTLQRKDGTTFTGSVYAWPIIQDNQPTGIRGAIIDITGRKQTARQQEILYQVLRAVSTQLDPDLVAQSAAETLAGISGYPHVCVAMPDKNREHWVVRGAAGSLAAGLGATYMIHQGVIGKMFETGQTQWVRDTLEDPSYVRDVAVSNSSGLRSEIVAPLRRGDSILGALNIESDRQDAFDEADARMIQSVADIISLALENAQSVQKIQQDINERKQAQSLQEAVYQIAAAAETVTSLDDLYPKIHQSIASVMPAENFYITLYDETQDLLRFSYFKDAEDEPFIGGIQPGKGLTAFVLKTGKSLLCTQAVHDELERKGEVKLLGVPSAIWLGVPLMVEGKTIGAMVVQHYTDPQAYGEREQHMLEFVSTQVAIAIQRKQAEDALRESEQRFRTLIEKAPVGINISRNGVEVYANQKDLEMFGLSKVEEIIDRPTAEFLVPQSREASLERTRRRGGGLPTPGEFETIAKRADGSQFPVQVMVDTVQLSDGPANLAFITDISERKQAQALQEAVYQIAAATEAAKSLDELYPKIHQSILLVMPAENFFIALYDEAQNLLKFPYFKDAEDEVYLGGMEPGRGTTAYVLRTGKSLLCTREVRAELERRGEVTLQGEPSAIWLGVPLINEGKTIGAMVVQHYSDPKAYGEREQHILEFVSTQVAIAIHRKQSEADLRENEIRYRGLFENSPVSLWEEDFSAVKHHIEELRQSGVTDFRAFFMSHPETVQELLSKIKVLDVNAATVSLLRATHKDQLIGNLKEVIRMADKLQFVDEFVNIAEGLTEFALEGDNYNLDGEKFTVSVQWSAAPGYADTLEKVLISLLDITARKRAEKAQQANERRYRSLFENSPVALWEQDFSAVKRHIEKLNRSGVTDLRAYLANHPQELQVFVSEIKVLDVNKAALTMMRADRKDQLLGNLKQVLRYEAGQDFVDELVNITEGRKEFAWEGINYTLDDQKLIVSLRWSTAPGSEDSLEKVLVSVMDITARKQAEEEIRTILRTTIEGYYMVDMEGRILDTNESYCSMTGYNREELVTMRVRDIEAVESEEEIRERIEQISKTGSTRFETRHRCKDGRIIDIEANVNLLEVEQPKICCFMRDITERKQAQAELEQAEARYRLLFEHAMEGIFQTTRAGQFITANPAIVNMLGYNSVEELNATSMNLEHEFYVQKGRRKEFRKSLEQAGEITGFESEIHRKDGSTLWISENARVIRDSEGKIVYYEGTLTDITERKRAEDDIRLLNAKLEQRVEERTRELRDAQEQLVRQEKLATLGQLAGGVGHELRNPLGVINSAVYYLKLVQPDADEKIKKYHLIIEQEVNTAGRIINDLLDFGRIVSPDRQPVSVPELLKRVLYRFPVPTTVQVQLKLPASLPKVFADPLHLEQVLGNLTTNACQAMKEGGTLTISARKSRPPASSHLPTGSYLMIAVNDTGTGISPENMRKLFEPLFTTKVRGIGLGLAVSKKLVEANGGSIAVQSIPGKGSTFTLCLPVKG